MTTASIAVTDVDLGNVKQWYRAISTTTIVKQLNRFG